MANKTLHVTEMRSGLEIDCGGLNANELREAARFVGSFVASATEVETPSGNGLTPDHDDIARLAFAFYELRGRQDGFDQEDWHLAEQELLRRRV